MFITYNGQKIELDEGVDIGYCIERTTIKTRSHGEIVIPARGITFVVISLPFINKSTMTELLELGREFEQRAIDGFEAILVLPDTESEIEVPFFKIAHDNLGEFGAEFGVAINCNGLNKKLSKALFVISRDNILFYKEVCKDLEDGFNLERFYMQIGKALNIYTGTGCH